MSFLTETVSMHLIRSMVPTAFRGYDLSTFETHCSTADSQTIAGRLYDYADHLSYSGHQSLVLFGKPGAGKTFAASCMFQEVAPGIPIRSKHCDAKQAGTADNIAFIRGDELVSVFKGIDQRRLYHLQTAHLLVLDDIDKCPGGCWQQPLLNLIDARLWTVGLPTIMTMNARPDRLCVRYPDIGAAWFSRMQRSRSLMINCDVLVLGKDPRQT